MATLKITNQTSSPRRYTVTIVHGTADCTINNLDIFTVEVLGNSEKTITVSGQSVKSAETDSEPIGT